MIKQSLIEYQRKLKKIDTHEHISPEEFAINSRNDIFDVLLIPYNCDTLFSAGCTDIQWVTIMDKSLTFEQRYEVLETFLPHIRFTGFFRATLKTLKLNFNENEFSKEALLRADAILKLELKNAHYSKYLQRYNIETMLCFSGYDSVNAYNDVNVKFIPTVSEILPRSISDITRLNIASNVSVFDLNTCLQAIDQLFVQYDKANVRAIKFGSAYHRTLNFALVSFMQAEEQLKQIFELRFNGDDKHNGSVMPSVPREKLIALDDYLTEYMINLSAKYNMTVVFHGAMHAWNENDPERAHVSYLTGIIARHSNVKFVILHAGAPFFEEAVLLARYYANVYLDLTWFHIISPQLVKTAITRILELVPINKVFAFGGDYCTVQTIAGHLEMAIENFADAFAEGITNGILTQEDAQQILKAWYYENPKRVFKI